MSALGSLVGFPASFQRMLTGEGRGDGELQRVAACGVVPSPLRRARRRFNDSPMGEGRRGGTPARQRCPSVKTPLARRTCRRSLHDHPARESSELGSACCQQSRAANRDLSPLPLELGLFTVCGAELAAPETAVARPIRFALEPLAAEAAVGSKLIGTLDHVDYVSGGNTTQYRCSGLPLKFAGAQTWKPRSGALDFTILSAGTETHAPLTLTS